MGVRVAISTVDDGNMLKRGDYHNQEALSTRQTFLRKHDLAGHTSYTLQASYNTADFCRYHIIGRDEIPHVEGRPHHFLCDAVVTTTPGSSVMLLIADCIGTVIHDTKQNIMMVSHLGRHSLEQHGARKSIDFLVDEFGSDPRDLQVWTTPAPGKDVYPIWALDGKGMKEAFFEQMALAGVPRENITDNPADSTKDKNYYSYSEYLKGNRDEDGDYAIVGLLT